MNEEKNMYQYQSLLQALEQGKKEGFVNNFIIKNQKIYDSTQDLFYEPNTVEIKKVFRIEGLSDPEEESILYALCSSQGNKGMLVEGYGVNANPKHVEVIEQFIDNS